MRTVKDHLIACVSVDSAHDTALDRSILVKCICHWCKTVGRAGCSRNDLILACKCLLVYREYDSLEILACRCGNNYLLSACVDVCHGLLLRAVETCALKNYVNADLAPRKIVSVSLFVDSKCLAVNCDGVSLIISCNSMSVLTYLAAVATLCGVVLEKICEHGRLGKVVDSNNIIALCAEHLSECQTSDTSKTIDCNFNCHNCYTS